MILLLGANSLAGQAFQAELQHRRMCFKAFDLDTADYAEVDVLYDLVKRNSPEFIINAGVLTGAFQPEPDKAARTRALCANMLVPQTVARVCMMRRIPWGHVSSGTIFRGVKTLQDDEWLTELDVPLAHLKRALGKTPETVRGFSEEDEPNHSFLYPPCDFYSGTIALGEQSLRDYERVYVWRPGLYILDQHHPLNLLSRARVGTLTHPNGAATKKGNHVASLCSVSHLTEFVCACIDLWKLGAPYGTYHMANPGSAYAVENPWNTHGATHSIHGVQSHPGPRGFRGFLLGTQKLSYAGIQMRPVSEALGCALNSLNGREWDGTRVDGAPSFTVNRQQPANDA